MERSTSNTTRSSTGSRRSDRLVVDVVSSIAETRGIDPVEVTASLDDILDPDALERIFRDRRNGAGRAGGTLVFSMCGCEVLVDGDLEVDVTPLDPDAQSDASGFDGG